MALHFAQPALEGNDLGIPNTGQLMAAASGNDEGLLAGTEGNIYFPVLFLCPVWCLA